MRDPKIPIYGQNFLFSDNGFYKNNSEYFLAKVWLLIPLPLIIMSTHTKFRKVLFNACEKYGMIPLTRTRTTHLYTRVIQPILSSTVVESSRVY